MVRVHTSKRTKIGLNEFRHLPLEIRANLDFHNGTTSSCNAACASSHLLYCEYNPFLAKCPLSVWVAASCGVQSAVILVSPKMHSASFQGEETRYVQKCCHADETSTFPKTHKVSYNPLTWPARLLGSRFLGKISGLQNILCCRLIQGNLDFPLTECWQSCCTRMCLIPLFTEHYNDHIVWTLTSLSV